MDGLTRQQRMRYARNISVQAIGEEGQTRLLQSTVFVVGCGALGSVVASYLAGAGVGHIILADYDTIDITNLQRQIHYCESQAGESKAETLASELRALNSEIRIDAVKELITRAKALELFAKSDFIIDASDNPDTKYMIDEVCVESGKAYSMAGVLAMGGQVMTHIDGSARYSDFFPQQDIVSGFTPCSVGGIIGPVAGIIGSIQALEAIKYLAGVNGLLTDRLLHLDGSTMRFTELHI
ncbi:MAG: HesA/MoeB/ThiF family protein [Paramuribaculum sp.]|nr:HesA/MoeB/ThiF family protein [Paramuribaculum sp.]